MYVYIYIYLYMYVYISGMPVFACAERERESEWQQGSNSSCKGRGRTRKHSGLRTKNSEKNRTKKHCRAWRGQGAKGGSMFLCGLPSRQGTSFLFLPLFPLFGAGCPTLSLRGKACECNEASFFFLCGMPLRQGESFFSPFLFSPFLRSCRARVVVRYVLQRV